jgi:ATP-binding cassette subfamily B protein
MQEWEEFHDEKDVGKVYDVALLRRLMGYLRPYRAQAAAAVALLVLSSLLELVGPLATALALDLYVRPLAGAQEPEGFSGWAGERLAAAGLDFEPAAGVTAMAGVFVAVVLLSFVVLYGQAYLMQLMGQLIMFDLRRDVFARLQALDVAFFDRRPIGRLVTRATTDVAALNELFSAALVSIFGDLFMLVGILTVLFVLDARLALVSFAILPLLYVITRWFKRGARRTYRDVRTRVARLGAFLQEHVTGMSLVQLMGREDDAFREFAAVNDAHRKANVRAIFYYGVYYPAVELVNAVGVALIVWYGGGQVIRGALTMGTLVAFLQYVQRFYRPLADLSEKYNVVQAAMASAERIFELLDAESEIVEPAGGYRPGEVRGEIELDGVSFAYRGDELVLRDVSFHVAPGETIAVVGHTGAGKSTLANLLLRFYDARSGSVRIDGVDVREWDLAALRGAIAMVLQDVVLFAGDVASNVRLGAAISDERLRRAAGEVHALGFIEELPRGFATVVRERGAGLSVGQKQLISFARALAFDPRILILDEATASIDTETEQRIQQALERLLVGRTSLVIAHRLSTIRRADRILVLHKGSLRELGTHEELLALGGIYHKLYQLQYREQDELATAGSASP